MLLHDDLNRKYLTGCPIQPCLKIDGSSILVDLSCFSIGWTVIFLLPLIVPELEEDATFVAVTFFIAHRYFTFPLVYLDRAEYARRKSTYLIVPVVCLVGVWLCYFFRVAEPEMFIFWSFFNYFHFVKQKYGLLRIYSSKTRWGIKRLDEVVVYGWGAAGVLHVLAFQGGVEGRLMFYLSSNPAWIYGMVILVGAFWTVDELWGWTGETKRSTIVALGTVFIVAGKTIGMFAIDPVTGPTMVTATYTAFGVLTLIWLVHECRAPNGPSLPKILFMAGVVVMYGYGPIASATAFLIATSFSHAFEYFAICGFALQNKAQSSRGGCPSSFSSGTSHRHLHRPGDCRDVGVPQGTECALALPVSRVHLQYVVHALCVRWYDLEIAEAEGGSRGGGVDIEDVDIEDRTMRIETRALKGVTACSPVRRRSSFNDRGRSCALVMLALVIIAACREREIRIHYEEAEAHRAAGRIDASIDHYRQILVLDSTDVNARNNIGFLHARMGRTDSALNHYQFAIRIDSTVAEAHYNAGVLFVAIEAFDSARAAYERAVRHDPRHVQAHNNLGTVLERGRRFDAALEHYEQAAAVDSTFVTAWANVGRIQFMMGQMEEAAKAYSKALSLKPDLTEAHAALASLYVESGDLDRAIQQLERATRLAPDSSLVKDSLVEVLAMREDRDRRRAGGEMRARHIVVKSEELARSLLQKVRSGEDFSALARTHSTDPSGRAGGDIGAFKPGDLLPAFEDVVKGLQPGEVGEPLRTAVGWHVIERIY